MMAHRKIAGNIGTPIETIGRRTRYERVVVAAASVKCVPIEPIVKAMNAIVVN